ncbi:MAG: hypothetical protein IJ557_10585, partial [Bacteroidaceae bacterium]|nr:hypothetical protein [Bacteroidaceae bacterium]
FSRHGRASKLSLLIWLNENVRYILCGAKLLNFPQSIVGMIDFNMCPFLIFSENKQNDMSNNFFDVCRVLSQ